MYLVSSACVVHCVQISVRSLGEVIGYKSMMHTEKILKVELVLISVAAQVSFFSSFFFGHQLEQKHWHRRAVKNV